ncbi:hypothetical protein TWF281_004677 [Arthrobotrys megalospora]
MIFLLLAPIFGSLASAFYIEVVSPSFPDLGPWQLCHATEPQGLGLKYAYELTLWAVDPAITDCDVTEGDPHFRMMEENMPQALLPKGALVDADASKWLFWQLLMFRGMPTISVNKDLYSALRFQVFQFGSVNKPTLITAIFKPSRHGNDVENYGDLLPGDILNFASGEGLDPNEMGFQIDLVENANLDEDKGELPGRLTIFRGLTNPEMDAGNPQVIFRVSSPARMHEIKRQAEALRPKPPKKESFFGGFGKSIANKVSSMKDSVKEKVSNAKGALKDRFKGKGQMGTDDVIERTRVQERFEEAKEEEDPEDVIGGRERYEGGLGGFYGEEEVLVPDVIEDTTVIEEPKILVFEVEQGVKEESTPEGNAHL